MLMVIMVMLWRLGHGGNIIQVGASRTVISSIFAGGVGRSYCELSLENIGLSADRRDLARLFAGKIGIDIIHSRVFCEFGLVTRQEIPKKRGEGTGGLGTNCNDCSCD